MNTELLKKIESRCVEVGDCLEWQGYISAGGSPRIYHDSRMQSARKLMLQAHCTPEQLRAHAILDRVRAGTCRSDYLIAWALLTLGEPVNA